MCMHNIMPMSDETYAGVYNTLLIIRYTPIMTTIVMCMPIMNMLCLLRRQDCIIILFVIMYNNCMYFYIVIIHHSCTYYNIVILL